MKTVRVKTSDVIPNPNNPRRAFDRIEELAASFDANGAHPGEPFTPPILVKDGSHYMIIDGERRFRAMRFLGLDEFTALVADDMDEADSFLAMVATNDKQQLTDEEKSRGIQKMLLLGIDPVKVGKAKEAAARFFEQKGYQILDRDFETPAGAIDFVVKDTDENVLVFCHVSVSDGEFAKVEANRGQIEAMSLFYMANKIDEIQDCAVRFDRIDIVVINEGRALLRHHINAFGEGSR